MAAIAKIQVAAPYTVERVLESLNNLKGLLGASQFELVAGQPGMIQFDSAGHPYSLIEVTALKAQIGQVQGVVTGVNQAVGGMSM